MYRKTKFLEVLQDIREEMSREADYDVLTLTEIARTGEKSKVKNRRLPVLNEEEDLTADALPLTTVYGNRV
jgi:hypothetical protein